MPFHLHKPESLLNLDCLRMLKMFETSFVGIVVFLSIFCHNTPRSLNPKDKGATSKSRISSAFSEPLVEPDKIAALNCTSICHCFIWINSLI